VVNLPVDGTTEPIFTLFIVPVVAGFTTSVPVPVGLIVTVAFAGLRLVAPVAVRELNVADLGVTPPIITLSNAPVDDGLIVRLLVTDKFGIGDVLARLIFTLLVTESVVITIPLEPVILRVLVVEFNESV
jgi:hypothetical protein